METIKIYKIGSGLLDSESELNQFLFNFSMIEGEKILIHGGGKSASTLDLRLGNKVIFHEGRRVTDLNSLEVITMVYAGKINKNIVSKLQELNCNAIGLSGVDGNLLNVRKRNSTPIDFGFVGDIESVNTQFLDLLFKNNMTPVICSVAGNKGQLLNINADTIAKECGVHLSKNNAVELFFIMDKHGVLENVNDDNSVIQKIYLNNVDQLIENKIIKDGMIPKIKNAIEAKKEKISKVIITSALHAFEVKAIKTEII